MSLSKLNRDCLLSVLEAASLKDQLYLRQVCTDWCDHLEGSLRRRHQLALLPIGACRGRDATRESKSEKMAKDVQENRQYFSGAFSGTVFALSEPLLVSRRILEGAPAYSRTLKRLFPTLKRLFPNLQKLAILPNHKGDASHCAGVTLEALRLWADTLTTVALNFHNGYHSWGALFQRLASLEKLRHLHIETFNGIGLGREAPSVATALRRLVTFSTHGGLDERLCFALFPSLAVNCRHLYLSKPCFGAKEGTPLPVLPYVTRLRIMNRRTLFHTARLYAAPLLRQLPALKELHIEWNRRERANEPGWEKEKEEAAKCGDPHHYFTLNEPMMRALRERAEKIGLRVRWITDCENPLIYDEPLLHFDYDTFLC